MLLKDLPADTRPREKLLARGPGALSDAELLALLLRTGLMRSIDVDPVARRVRVGAGALWDEVVISCEGAGLTPLAGSSPDVGVAGYSLGGGIAIGAIHLGDKLLLGFL